MPLVAALGWCCCALALAGLAIELLNVREFPVLAPREATRDHIVACVAMRNAMHDAAGCVDGLLAQREIAAVVICDDHSNDDTAETIRALSRDDARVLTVSAGEGRGKSAALAAASRAACARDARMLLFTDVDVRLEPGAVSALIAYAGQAQVDAVSAWPRTTARSLWDAIFSQALIVFLLQALPLRWARTSGDPRFAAANGQLFLIERHAYQRSGGHARCRELVEDVALARLLKASGARIALASAARIASTSGYGTLAANVNGYGRSLRHGLGRAGTLSFAAWQLFGFLGPWILLPLAPLPALIALAAIALANVAVSDRLRNGSVWLPSLVVGGLVAGSAAFWCGVSARQFEWRGRRL